MGGSREPGRLRSRERAGGKGRGAEGSPHTHKLELDAESTGSHPRRGASQVSPEDMRLILETGNCQHRPKQKEG